MLHLNEGTAFLLRKWLKEWSIGKVTAKTNRSCPHWWIKEIHIRSNCSCKEEYILIGIFFNQDLNYRMNIAFTLIILKASYILQTSQSLFLNQTSIEVHIYIAKVYYTSQSQLTLSRSKYGPYLFYYWPILPHLDSQLFTQYLLSGYVLCIVLEVGNMIEKRKIYKCLTQGVYILLHIHKVGENEIHLIMINSKKNQSRKQGGVLGSRVILKNLILFLCLWSQNVTNTHSTVNPKTKTAVQCCNYSIPIITLQFIQLFPSHCYDIRSTWHYLLPE